MSSQWDVHKQRSDWSQRDWHQSGWSDASRWGSEDRIQSGSVERTARTEEYASQSGVESWAPSLRMNYVPVVTTPSQKRFVRSVTPRRQAPPKWEEDKQWQKRVEELMSPSLSQTSKNRVLSGKSSNIDFESQYGKQRSQPPTRGVDYGPGQGSRLNPALDDCFFDNYEMAPWESHFVFNNKRYPLPRNNLELEQYAIRSDFENLVNNRHREASRSRDRRTDEPEPGTQAVNVLNHYWNLKEMPYDPINLGIVPKPLDGTNGVMDLELLYDNSPHDGLETTLSPGTKTTWCKRYLIGTCPFGRLCGHRHGQVIVKCVDYLTSGLVKGKVGDCVFGKACPYASHGGHTPFESNSREVGSRAFSKPEADAYKKVQVSSTWPENVFPLGYWRANGWKGQWVNDQPHLYYLSGTSGTRWPRHSWKCSNKPYPAKYKVAPLIFDEEGRMRPQFCWTFPPHIGPKPSALIKSGWIVSGTKSSLQRLVFEANTIHHEAHLLKDLVFLQKPDPADDMGGMIKDHMKNPPEAVSRFLKTRNAVHMPDATDPSIVQDALRRRKRIQVMQIPGTLGKSQDLSTLDYPDIHMGDVDPEEAAILPAFPAFMDGTNQSINFPIHASWAKFCYIFRKGRMKDDLSKAAEARTARDWPFGETVEPFVNGEWEKSYYGRAEMTEEHQNNYSAWIVSQTHGDQPSNNPIAHMKIPNASRYWPPRSKVDPSGKSSSDAQENRIFFTAEYMKVERNPSRKDLGAERLGLAEASLELFGDHRKIEVSPAVDQPGNREAAEYLLVNLPFVILRPLMEYYPNSPYWETEAQAKALDYWKRTPYYPSDPNQAFSLCWYMKSEGERKPRSVFRNRKSGKHEAGVPVDYSDNKLAPTGVSVIFATHEPHNKRQDMSILLHPVMDADGKRVKFLSTFRQEIGPCVQVFDAGQSGIKGGGGPNLDMLYPPAAIYGTNMDWLIIAQILAVRRHAYNNGPMPYFLLEELNRHTFYMRFADEWKFFHIIPRQMMEEIVGTMVILQEYKPTPESGMKYNPYLWKNEMVHPQIVPIHEITVDGRVYLKNKNIPSGSQLCEMRGVDAEAVRNLLHMPTLSKQLEEMTLVTPHDLAIISTKGTHYSMNASHLGDSEKRVERRVNFPRKMEEGPRELVLLKNMARRFEDMGEPCPQEYIDELEAAYLPGKTNCCHQDQCTVEENVMDDIFMNLCVACESSYCKDHWDDHNCIPKKKPVEILTKKPWAEDWKDKPGSAFELLDPLPSGSSSSYNPAVPKVQIYRPQALSSAGAAPKGMPKRTVSRPPVEKKPVMSPPSCLPPTRPCPTVEDVEKTKRGRSISPGLAISGNTEGDKRARNMERDTAARARSCQSADVTPHPSTWVAPWEATMTALDDDSDPEPLDPTKDRSGVPLQEDQTEEEQMRMSVTSSGKDTVAIDVDPEAQTDADRIQVVDEATIALATAENNMAILRASILEKDQEIQKKEKLFEESQEQINELKKLVEDLRVSIASLQRPVIEATVVSGMSSSSTLDQSMDASWQLTTSPQETPAVAISGISVVPVNRVYCSDCELWLNGPRQLEEHKVGSAHKNVIQQLMSRQSASLVSGSNAVVLEEPPVDAVLLEVPPVDAILLDEQQARVFLPGRVFEGDHGVGEETNVVTPMDTSPGSPQEVSPQPGMDLFQRSPVAIGIAPTSPPDFGDGSPTGETTPIRTPPRSPRSGSMSVRRLIDHFVRRSPSARR